MPSLELSLEQQKSPQSGAFFFLVAGPLKKGGILTEQRLFFGPATCCMWKGGAAYNAHMRYIGVATPRPEGRGIQALRQRL